MTEVKKKATKKGVAEKNVGGKAPVKRTRIKSEKSAQSDVPEVEEIEFVAIKATAADYGFSEKREAKKANETQVDTSAESEMQVRTKTERKGTIAIEEFDWDRFESDGLRGSPKYKEQEALYDETLSTVAVDEVVMGTVIQMTSREVVINIGYKSEGVVSLNEFRYNPNLKAGDKVEVYVESQEDKKGQLSLSHKKARAIKSWDRVNAALENEEIITGYIKCRTKGGMIVDVFGIEAFLPGSQIDVKPIRDYDLFVGKTLEFKVVKINKGENPESVLSDVLIQFTGPMTKKYYPKQLRKIKYKAPDTGKVYQFLTNDFNSNALDIAGIYKERWEVELFFKWIKQHLKIKSFYGTSRNAVYSQIWSALILTVLLWISRILDGIVVSTYELLIMMKSTLFTKTSLSGLCTNIPHLMPANNSLQLVFTGFLC